MEYVPRKSRLVSCVFKSLICGTSPVQQNTNSGLKLSFFESLCMPMFDAPGCWLPQVPEMSKKKAFCDSYEHFVSECRYKITNVGIFITNVGIFITNVGIIISEFLYFVSPP